MVHDGHQETAAHHRRDSAPTTATIPAGPKARFPACPGRFPGADDEHHLPITGTCPRDNPERTAPEPSGRDELRDTSSPRAMTGAFGGNKPAVSVMNQQEKTEPA